LYFAKYEAIVRQSLTKCHTYCPGAFQTLQIAHQGQYWRHPLCMRLTTDISLRFRKWHPLRVAWPAFCILYDFDLKLTLCYILSTFFTRINVHYRLLPISYGKFCSRKFPITPPNTSKSSHITMIFKLTVTKASRCISWSEGLLNWVGESQANLHFVLDEIVGEGNYSFWPVLDIVHHLVLSVTVCDII